ncbi:hypothetical protein [Thermoactinomyces sp. DSM 45892]|uniref:hypothetical protein n=1 Tax=Thermoactinomyces sp. DSM 45892 TaxID=1882753 RepID=UPI000894D7A4|nr:hypothetical protein [Thermoactinomyces sp. DSM 45892]SDZ20627.1 hypothetical protein SAMN05444416_11625 [Thermoactinomyces sp. DSM 45892]
MKSRTAKLIGLFFASVAMVPLSGCSSGSDVEFCEDLDSDKFCDDDGSTYNPNSYLIKDGKKVGYVKYDDSSVSSSSGG